MKVLVINPGATSTKVAVFDEETQVYKTTVDHSPQELDRFDRVIDQADYRQQAILDAVAQSGFRLSDFDAVCGRGGLYRPIPSGTYAVNDRVMHDVETAPPMASIPPTWGRIWPGASATWWAFPPFSWTRCAWMS